MKVLIPQLCRGGPSITVITARGEVCTITDREGRQILSIDRLGNRVETEYDIDGDPVRRVSCDKHGEHRDVRTWRYDCLGYLKEAVGGGFRYRYEYRPDGKLLRKEVPGHATLHLPSGWQCGDHD